jgi:Polysaccharide lyase
MMKQARDAGWDMVIYQVMLKSNHILRVVAGLLLLSAGISLAQDTTAPLDVYDGFETPSLSKVWSADRFAPGAVQMQTNIFRAGHSAVEITVRPNDKFEAGINGNSDSERAELLEAKKLTSKENEAYEFSFSMFFPKDFPIVPTRLVIAHWKQYCPEGGNCSDDSPVLAIRYISGVLKITQDLDKHQTILYQEPGEFRNRWLDFKFQTRFSPNNNGRIRAWLGEKQLVDFTGVTANPENAATSYPSPSRFYFKMGLYRNVMPEPMTIYIDEYRKKQLSQNSF